MDTQDLQNFLSEALKLDEASVVKDAYGNITGLKLTCPVKDEGAIVDALNFRRVLASDLAASEGLSEQKKAALMLSRLTGLSLGAIASMDGYDFNQANKVVGNFLTVPRRTGAVS